MKEGLFRVHQMLVSFQCGMTEFFFFFVFLVEKICLSMGDWDLLMFFFSFNNFLMFFFILSNGLMLSFLLKFFFSSFIFLFMFFKIVKINFNWSI